MYKVETLTDKVTYMEHNMGIKDFPDKNLKLNFKDEYSPIPDKNNDMIMTSPDAMINTQMTTERNKDPDNLFPHSNISHIKNQNEYSFCKDESQIESNVNLLRRIEALEKLFEKVSESSIKKGQYDELQKELNKTKDEMGYIVQKFSKSRINDNSKCFLINDYRLLWVCESTVGR